MNAHRFQDPWPSPPHDPRDRIRLCEVDGWEIRVSHPRGTGPPDGRQLQLWHPARHVSVLSPSAQTGGCWEVFPLRGWVCPLGDYEIVRDVVARALHAPMPTADVVDALGSWFTGHAFTERPVDHAFCPPAASTTPPAGEAWADAAE